MPTIFLDYDGVLNNGYWYAHSPLRERGNWSQDFDPKRVDILREICHRTNAKIVLTSSWRGNQEARAYLVEQKLPIVDALPLDYKRNRGKLIERYVKKHKIKRYIIIDDESLDFSDEQEKHLLFTREAWTNSSKQILDSDKFVGLQPKHIDWAISLLEGNYPFLFQAQTEGVKFAIQVIDKQRQANLNSDNEGVEEREALLKLIRNKIINDYMLESGAIVENTDPLTSIAILVKEGYNRDNDDTQN